MLFALLGVLALVCYLSYSSLTTETREVPDFGGTYTEGLVGQPTFINPILAPTLDSPSQDLIALVFAGLTRFDEHGAVRPDLAERWQIGPDGRTYTFALRHDVTWHDGQPFTANDVIFTITALQDPDFKGNADLAAVWRDVALRKVDDFTVQFTRKEVFAPFLDYTTMGILPQHLLGKVPAASLPDHRFNVEPVGTGPFQIEEVRPDHVSLSAYRGYYGTRPFLQRVEFRFYPNAAAALSGLRRREVLGVSQVDPAEVEQLAADPDVRLYHAVRSSYTSLLFNLRDPLFADVRVRHALALAVDRKAIVARWLHGQGVVANVPTPPASWAYNSTAGVYDVDPARAAQLLDEAGWKLGAGGVRAKDGRPLHFTITTNDTPLHAAIANDLAAQLGAIGVKVDILAPGFAGFVRDFLAPHRFQAALFNWDLPGGDPDWYASWHSSQSGGAGANFGFFANDKADALLEQARQTVDQSKRAELYRQFQQIFADEMPAVMLYYPLYNYALSKEVGGVQLHALTGPGDRFDGITGWFIKRKLEIRRRPLDLPRWWNW